MRGSITKKHGSYYVRVELGPDPENPDKRKQKWIKVDGGKKAAETLLTETLKQLNDGQYVEPVDMTLGEYLTDWLTKVQVRPSTLDTYKWAVEKQIIPSIGKIELHKVRPIDIENHNAKILKKDISPTSARYQFRVLSIALKKAMRLKLISLNPCDAVDPPKKAKFKASILSPKQLQVLLKDSSDTDYYLPILLATTCGLRRGEACGLCWTDVDLDKGIMSVRNSLGYKDRKPILMPTKTDNSERTIKIPKMVIEILKKSKKIYLANKLAFGEAYDKRDFIWCWENGTPRNPDWLTHQFKEILDKSSLPMVRFHDLRHSHASYLIQEGVPIKTISDQLGHSSTSFTQDIYGHMMPPMQQKAADVTDLMLQIEDKPKRRVKKKA